MQFTADVRGDEQCSIPLAAHRPADPADPADPAAAAALATAVAARARAEAAAEALLAQLAIDSRNSGLVLPSYLDTKPKIAVAVAVGMSGLIAVALVGMTILGAILH
jgi:hypothetical protein